MRSLFGKWRYKFGYLKQRNLYLQIIPLFFLVTVVFQLRHSVKFTERRTLAHVGTKQRITCFNHSEQTHRDTENHNLPLNTACAYFYSIRTSHFIIFFRRRGRKPVFRQDNSQVSEMRAKLPMNMD